MYAKWDKLVTTPPMGVVEEYHIEYRPFEKKSANSIRNMPDKTEITISNVVDAGLYQVRGENVDALIAWVSAASILISVGICSLYFN